MHISDHNVKSYIAKYPKNCESFGIIVFSRVLAKFPTVLSYNRNLFLKILTYPRPQWRSSTQTNSQTNSTPETTLTSNTSENN
jgi:hypothetical protein